MTLNDSDDSGGDRGSTVVNVLCYNSEGRWFDPCTLSRQDLMDFLKRLKWKLYKQPSRSKSAVNFLTVLDMPY